MVSMAPLVCLIAAFVVFRLLGMVIPHFSDWHMALRAALGIMFLLTASAHWGKRRADLVRMVPDGFGNPGLWVTLTGIAEIALAAGLQAPRLAPVAAMLAALMLCCLFPANVRAAREHLTIAGRPVLSLPPRLLIQLAFIAAAAGSVWPRRR